MTPVSNLPKILQFWNLVEAWFEIRILVGPIVWRKFSGKARFQIFSILRKNAKTDNFQIKIVLQAGYLKYTKHKL